MKNLQSLIRPNILALRPYSSARNEFHGDALALLDANENPHNPPYNRYPDPAHLRLKNRIAQIKDIAPEHIFLGNGSDEAIDLVIRAFCEPRLDNIVAIAPTYGMYEVAAGVNNVEYVKAPLRENFSLDAAALLDAVTKRTKVVFLCTPNNPTGNLLEREEIYCVLKHFGGIVVVDEAYIDFSASPSLTRQLLSHPNLIVLQTMSKAWGAAGIRLGIAFASEAIIGVLNKIKHPYNLSRLAQDEALRILSREEFMQEKLALILSERSRLEDALAKFAFVRRVYPSDANFILVKVDDANATYNHLANRGVIVRNRSGIPMCENCIRITVGSPKENDALLKALSEVRS
ncbi:MAG: histidinol-phosphate transaminase [Tannerellaceae bacterium]|jgi:histidinol-phosphate aminotransferase|nr:histidinol-phosphate transaminase [Tannerellaceae bacterium]